jgi:hypothetical protein
MKTQRPPQLRLRLEAAVPDADAQWRAGSAVVHLGENLTLVLDTACRLPERIGAELHLPLPPAATARQIRDAAESWLRDEALRVFGAIAQKSALAGRRPNDAGRAGRRPPRIVLGFGKRGDWTKREGDVLRCHWRLIEQPLPVIAQVLEHALAASAPLPACDDLFACA